MRTLGLVLLAATASACFVTRAPTLAQRPRWQIGTGAAYDQRCLAARAFVRKSGKEGFGLALQLRSHRDCRVALAGARLVLGGRELVIPAADALDMRARSQAYLWLPVHFDNNTAWNAGQVTARLVLALTLDGTPAAPWELDLADEARRP